MLEKLLFDLLFRCLQWKLWLTMCMLMWRAPPWGSHVPLSARHQGIWLVELIKWFFKWREPSSNLKISLIPQNSWTYVGLKGKDFTSSTKGKMSMINSPDQRYERLLCFYLDILLKNLLIFFLGVKYRKCYH